MSRDAQRSPSHPAAENIRAIVALQRQANRRASFGEHLGRIIGDAIGTMRFAAVHGIAMLAPRVSSALPVALEKIWQGYTLRRQRRVPG